MAYSTGNPPVLVSPAMAGGLGSTVGGSTAATGYLTAMGGFQIWGYRSSDPMTTVVGSSYITNGYNLGMRVGDMVWAIDVNSTTTVLPTWLYVSAVTTTLTNNIGGVTLGRASSGV